MTVVSPALHAELVALWSFRARNEHETSDCYQSLAHRLRWARAPAALVSAAEAAAADELRHEAQCQQVVEAMGAAAPATLHAAPARWAPAQLSEVQALIYEGVALGCLTETLNVALIASTLPDVRDPRIERVLRSVLKDEVRHSRLGWAVLAWGTQTTPCDWLQPLLPALTASAMLPESVGQGDDDERLAVGLVPRARHQAIVRQCLDHVIMPGLRSLKVMTAGPSHP